MNTWLFTKDHSHLTPVNGGAGDVHHLLPLYCPHCNQELHSHQLWYPNILGHSSFPGLSAISFLGFAFKSRNCYMSFLPKIR